jgi:predicted acylesterase/phospholipase RssA
VLHRSLRRLRFFVLFISVSLLASCHASPAAAEEALVLSGGGARGLAHVGAVVGLERRGHDPDIVVGTSMGAIVGGLYAAGYTADEIDEIIAAEDWRAIFTPYPFEFGPSRGLRYPVLRFQSSESGALITRSYIPDWQINRKLVRLLFPASARARGDFDRLPRRFRSATADAANGELVSIGSGDLARAVRASMAAGGFFAPVLWGGRLLTDGGIADYLPVHEARRLGADTVIAVDVLRPPAALPSDDAIVIARRSIELLTIRARRNPVPPDVLVVPALDPKLAPFDYPVDPAPVVEEGLKAMLAALPPGHARRPDPGRTLGPQPSSLAALSVEGTRPALVPFLRRAFRKTAPRRYEPNRILRVVDRLYATGLFDGVWPSVEDSMGAAAPILRIRAEPRGPVSIAGAIGYDNDRGGRIWASLRRLDAIGSVPSEVALEGTANGVEQWGAASVRLSSLALGGSAWTAGAFYGETEIRFFDLPGDAGDVEVRRVGGWLGFESRWIAPSAFASIGVRADAIDQDAGQNGAAIGPWIRIGRVPAVVQVVGTPLAVEAEGRFGEAGYWRGRAKHSVAARVGSAAVALLADVTLVSKDAPLDVAPAMGDESLVPGFRSGERRARLRAVGGLDAAHAMAFNATLRLRLRGGFARDEARAGDGVLRYDSDDLSLGGIGISSLWWTPFGKVEIGLEGSTLGDRRAVVVVGSDF